MGQVHKLKPARIVYVVTEDWYFWSHRLSLAEAALAEGHEVYVITHATDHGHRILARGFKLISLRLPRSFGNPLGELIAVIKLARLYRQIKPDIVHHIALKAIFSGSVAAELARVPHIINSYTGLGYLFTSRSLFSRLFMTLVVPVMALLFRQKRYHAIIQNNEDGKLLEDIGLITPGRYTLVRGSGVDMNVFTCTAEPPANNTVVLFASRLLRDKGIIDFIEAVRLLKGKGSMARFVIVGDIDMNNPTSITQAELSDWVVEGIIEWWGHRDEMQQVFSQVHIVCLPSYREGLPKVLLEAAACGRPIVTTDVPGCRDVVVDGVNGLLVPARNPVRLASAIAALLDSKQQRQAFGQAGVTRVRENFEINLINTATIKLYNQTLDKLQDHT